MKKTIRILSLLFVLVIVSSSLIACNDKKDEEKSDPKFTELPPYDTEKLDDYIESFEYTALSVKKTDKETDADAIWRAVLERVTVKLYPADQVDYYEEQQIIKYKYFASKENVDYEKFLESMGVTDESIRDDAKALVKKDLALLYIVKDASLSLTDAEKEAHFDKYVDRFVEIYGYDKEHVSKNMEKQIYEAMLFDKTSEYLILNNNIT